MTSYRPPAGFGGSQTTRPQPLLGSRSRSGFGPKRTPSGPGVFITPVPRIPKRPSYDQTMLDELKASRFAGAFDEASAEAIGDVEKLRQFYEQQKANALKRAGKAAGAPYSAAIANLDREIAAQRTGLGNLGEAYGTAVKNTEFATDVATRGIEGSSVDDLEGLKAINRRIHDSVNEAHSDTEMAMIQSMAAAGVTPEGIKQATATLSEAEKQINDMEDVSLEQQSNIMMLAEKAAASSAVAKGASSAAEIIRRQIMVEGDVKDRINQMVGQRREAVAARNAAIQAAQDQELSRWPDNVPFGSDAYAGTVADLYMDQAMAGVPDNIRTIVEEMTVGDFYQGKGMNAAQLRVLLKTPAQKDVEGNWINPPAAEALGIQWQDSIGVLPREVKDALSQYGPYILESIDKAKQEYNVRFKDVDPNQYQPGTVASGMAWYEFGLQNAMSEPEAQFFAKNTEDQELAQRFWGAR